MAGTVTWHPMAKNKRRAAAVKKAGAKKQAPAAPSARAARPPRPHAAPAMSTAARRRRNRQRLIRAGIIAAVVAVVGAIAANVVSERQSESEARSVLTAAGCELNEDFDDDAGSGRNHREGVTYEVDPPAGGDHSPSPMPAGTYAADDAPDDRVVHSMEHGYVVIWHRGDLPDEDMDAIDEVVTEHGKDVLLVERPTLEVPVAATAWHRRALCDEVDADALEAFVVQYRNKGPEKVAH